MTRKWRLIIALLALFTLIAAACGNDSSGEADEPAPSDEVPGDASPDEGLRVALVLPGEINDLSWNQQMHAGAQELENEGLISDLAFTELVPEGDAERAIRGFAEDGFDLIVAHSFGYGETAKAVAADFPDIAFA